VRRIRSAYTAMWIANVHQASLSEESSENAESVFRIVFPLHSGVQTNGPPASDSLTSVS